MLSIGEREQGTGRIRTSMIKSYADTISFQFTVPNVLLHVHAGEPPHRPNGFPALSPTLSKGCAARGNQRGKFTYFYLNTFGEADRNNRTHTIQKQLIQFLLYAYVRSTVRPRYVPSGNPEQPIYIVHQDNLYGLSY